MHRVRLLVLKAHPNLENSAHERILITNFMLGLHDKQHAAFVAVVKVQAATEAVRLAAERLRVRRDQKSRKSSGNYLLPSASHELESEREEMNLSKEEQLMATLADLRARRGNSTEQRFGRRKTTSFTECYTCGQYGHYKSDCPQRWKSRFSKRQSTRPSTVECQLCAGNHYVRVSTD